MNKSKGYVQSDQSQLFKKTVWSTLKSTTANDVSITNDIFDDDDPVADAPKDKLDDNDTHIHFNDLTVQSESSWYVSSFKICIIIESDVNG